MRKLFMLVALLLVVVGVACTAAPTPAPTAAPPTKAPAAPAFRVGLVTDVGKIDDKSFNQSTWEGVQKASKEIPGVTEIKYIETTDPKDYDKNIAQFADAKYDVIVTVGFALTDATYAAAKKYPSTKFVGIDQFLSKDKDHPDWPLSNLVGVTFDEDKAGYLAGALAAQLSKTGTIGAVLGTDVVPPVWRFGEGYRAGAKAINPNINIVVVYHSDVGFDKTFTDPEWGKTTALSQIDKKADVVFGAGGKTGNGALLGAAEKKVFCIGVDTDQYLTVPEAKGCLVSSAMKLLTPSTFNMIKAAKDGAFKGGLYTGPVGLAPYHDLDAQVPAAVKTKIQELDKGLQDGTIKTNVAPAKP